LEAHWGAAGGGGGRGRQGFLFGGAALSSLSSVVDTCAAQSSHLLAQIHTPFQIYNNPTMLTQPLRPNPSIHPSIHPPIRAAPADQAVRPHPVVRGGGAVHGRGPHTPGAVQLQAAVRFRKGARGWTGFGRMGARCRCEVQKKGLPGVSSTVEIRCQQSTLDPHTVYPARSATPPPTLPPPHPTPSTPPSTPTPTPPRRTKHPPRQAIFDIAARAASPAWLVEEVATTRAGLLALRQNVCLLEDEEDEDAFYPRWVCLFLAEWVGG